MNLSLPFFNRAKKAVKSAAMATVVSIANTLVHITRANLWRDSFNPLRGLTMRRVVALLEEGERGAFADLQWTYRFIEKRDATLRGGKRSLIGGVTEKDFEIRTVPEDRLPDGATKKMADAQAKTLREAYDRIDNMREAIEHLALGEFRGFAHLEKHLASGGPNDGAVIHLEPVEQWYLCREGHNGEWSYNEGARSGRTRGTPLDEGNFIFREIDDPIDEIALIAFVRKNLSQKDWDGFIESFGIPSIFIIMPQQVPQGKEDEYQDVAEQIAGDGRGTLPFGADVKTVNEGQKGEVPFEKHIDYQDQQIALAITSGMLTMLAESGSGTLAGGAHSDTFERVVRALCKRISETFQSQFDEPTLAELHPNEPVLAWFEIAANEEQDSGEFVKDVQNLSSAGYRVDPSQIAEKTGYLVSEKEPAPSPTDPQNPDPLHNRGTGRADVPPADALADALGVPESWTAPVADLWQEIEAKISDSSLSDADLLDFIEQAADRIPELFTDMDIAGLTDVFAAQQGSAVLEGLRQALQKKSAIKNPKPELP